MQEDVARFYYQPSWKPSRWPVVGSMFTLIVLRRADSFGH
jgi:hypothetical protein